MRFVIRLFLLLAVLLAFAPFVISSLLIDQKGVVIPGRIAYKSEYIVVHYASWSRKLKISVEYGPPDGSGVSYFDTDVTADRFDALKKGQPIQLRYLRRVDVPDYPGMKTLREMHALPMVHLIDQPAFSWVQDLFFAHQAAVTAVLVTLLILLVWKLARLPYFAWIAGMCIVVAIAISLVARFPRPLPSPRTDVRTASATVESLEQIQYIFRENHERGFSADQPIQVAGLRFIPEGRSEPVVAVDLIDAGSVPTLREHGVVGIEYEAASPRVAQIQNASRTFARQNFRGIVVELVASVAVVIGLFGVGKLIGRGYRALTQRKSA